MQGDRRILAHASCTHPKCPEDPKITRARMYETGFIIEPLPEPGLTNIVYVIKVRLQSKNNVPAVVVVTWVIDSKILWLGAPL